jgi:hypothetical protein
MFWSKIYCFCELGRPWLELLGRYPKPRRSGLLTH